MEITASELRRNFGGYLELARKGESIVVTKNGVPVARLIPCEMDRKTALEGLVGLIPDSGLDARELKALRLAPSRKR